VDLAKQRGFIIFNVQNEMTKLLQFIHVPMKNNDIEIKKTTAEVLPDIHAIILEENHSDIMRILGFVPGPGDILRQTLDDPDYEPVLFLGAFDKDVLVGTVMGTRRPWKQADTAFIKWIIVKKQYRNRGVGRRLLRACESAMKDAGVKNIIYGSASPLYLFPGVPKESNGAVRLLESCG
jgi:ribosomal protein S18 acetylase RimI-like enzyme